MSLEPQPVPTTPATANIEHTSYVTENFLQLYNSKDYSDLTLVVAGEQIHAHKIILAAQSHYFRTLLFGGFEESFKTEVELKVATSVAAFKDLLKYIYTGRISLSDRSEDVILDILRLARLYGLFKLECSIVDYLREIVSIKNVCSIFDAALYDRFVHLIDICLEFMDKHAAAIIKQKSFLKLSYTAVNELISRESFYAPEIEIFLAVKKWVHANPDVDNKTVLSAVRFGLIPIKELLDVVRSSGLVSTETVLDAITVRTYSDNLRFIYRPRLQINENMAHPKQGAIILHGKIGDSLLEDNGSSYNEENGIVIKLGGRCFINHIKMLLWDTDGRSYSYYIEVSLDQNTWTRVIDYHKYYCRSWQFLYFHPRVVLYIRIVGTSCTNDRVFHVQNLEASYKIHFEEIERGFVLPTKNIATHEHSATVVKKIGTQNIHTLLDGNILDYIVSDNCTSQKLGVGQILVQFGQPYIIESMRLLLYDKGSTWYSYYIQVSADSKHWAIVLDKRNERCRSWQTIKFHPPRRVVFVRIIGTHSSIDNDFRCVHFECPAQIDDVTESS